MISYLSLFSGIGAFESAMRNLNIPFNLVGFSEIDKYAVKSYCAIHNISEVLNLGDITKIDETKLQKVDFITYGFPCQDISLAGKQQGLFNDDGTKTRSGLFFDALRIIAATKPKVAIAENVKNLTSKKFAEQFKIVLNSLEEVGYNNYWAVLNSKDFGIPQNRERVFIISIRKDVDTGVFEFPEPYPLKLRLKDLLEHAVDEKFYIDSSKVKNTEKFTNFETALISKQEPCLERKTDVANTLLARDFKGFGNQAMNCVVEPIRLGNIYGEQFGTGYAGNVWDKDAISPALMTMQGGNRQPMIVAEPKIIVIGNYSPSNHDASRIVHPEGLAPRVKENHGTVTAIGQNLRIRKLTPKECFRLMGFKDEEFEKAEQVNSNTQLYKQAGNSIVVDVAEELLCMLFDEDGNFFI